MRIVVDQSGNVGINTIADPSYNLDVRKNGYGDILRLRNESLSAGADIDLLLGGTHVVGTYLNSAKTTTWPHGTPLFLKSGGTTVVKIEPAVGSAVAFPSAFDLTSEKLTIGGGEGLAGQVVKAKGDGFGGVEWGTGSGGDSSGNAAIPYEPWNLNITLSEHPLATQDIYLQQFFAPSTAKYTNMVIFTSETSNTNYSGTLGVAIYSDVSGIPGPGIPFSLLGSGKQTFTSTNMNKRYNDIALDLDASGNPSTGIDLSGNTIYWAAFAANGAGLFTGFHNDFHSVRALVRIDSGGFSASTFANPIIGKYH